MRDIRYKWNEGPNSVGVSSEVSLPQFKVLGHRQRAMEISLTTGTCRRSPISLSKSLSISLCFNFELILQSYQSHKIIISFIRYLIYCYAKQSKQTSIKPKQQIILCKNQTANQSLPTIIKLF